MKGVIGLASAFHKHVIAEDVESVANGKNLIELGCNLGQGYGIALPMAASQILEWSATWEPPSHWTRAD